jgi:hypothetical protein
MSVRPLTKHIRISTNSTRPRQRTMPLSSRPCQGLFVHDSLDRSPGWDCTSQEELRSYHLQLSCSVFPRRLRDVTKSCSPHPQDGTAPFPPKWFTSLTSSGLPRSSRPVALKPSQRWRTVRKAYPRSIRSLDPGISGLPLRKCWCRMTRMLWFLSICQLDLQKFWYVLSNLPLSFTVH